MEMTLDKNKKTFQVQLTAIDENGEETYVDPINTLKDVQVGLLSSGSLRPPGSNENEMLETTLMNLRKYCVNLQNVADDLREVSQTSRDTSKINIPSTAVTAELQTDVDDIYDNIERIDAFILTLAEIDHSYETLKYGGATGTKYGHAKLSDIYASPVENGSAAYSIAPSQAALYNAYNDLNLAKAPNNHAVAAGIYGFASSALYGHVKTSDTYDTTSADAAEVATRKGLYNAWFALKTINDNQQTAIDGKAPTNHASSETKYGLATAGAFGHVKINDGYDIDNSATGAAANAVSASSWALYRAYSSLSTVVAGKLANSHKDEKASSSKFSHVKLTDTYDSSQGAASAAVAPSSLALYNAYAALSSSITNAQNSISAINTTISEMRQSFQDGVDSIYNALVGQGTTPGGKTPADLVDSIQNIGGKVTDTVGGYAEEYHLPVGTESTWITNSSIIAPKGSYVLSFCMKKGKYGVPQPEHAELIRNLYYSCVGVGLEFKIFKVTADSSMTFNQDSYNYTNGAFVIA